MWDTFMTTDALQSLDDVIAGREPEAVQAPAADAPGDKPTEPAAQADDKPADAAKPDDAAPPPDADKGKQEPKEEWTKAAVIDERRKRQDAERRLAELEKKLQEPAKKPDLFEDPEGVLSQHRQEVGQQLLETRIDLSEELMREQHPDYDELKEEFVQLATENPFYADQLAKAKNPAKFAYETAKKARQAASLGDVDKMRAELESKIRGELEQKIRKELEGKFEKDGKKRDATGEPSLAATTAKSSASTVPDESLDSILKR
jgi:hypothetical protein